MLWVLKIGLLVYAGFGAVLYFAQRTMIYFPMAENPATDVAEERIDVGDATLKVWVVNASADEAILYFGGNAEDVYHNAADFGQMTRHTTYLVNYRGYGGSTGKPSEAALFADALLLFDRVAARHRRVSVVGRSLGSAVATYLASQRPVQRLVLITPPDSVAAIARRLYPVYPVRLILKDRFDSAAYAPQVDAPVLILTARNDTLIPREHSRRLAESFDAGIMQYLELAGVGHNDIQAHPDYWSALRTFVER